MPKRCGSKLNVDGREYAQLKGYLRQWLRRPYEDCQQNPTAILEARNMKRFPAFVQRFRRHELGRAGICKGVRFLFLQTAATGRTNTEINRATVGMAEWPSEQI